MSACTAVRCLRRERRIPALRVGAVIGHLPAGASRVSAEYIILAAPRLPTGRRMYEPALMDPGAHWWSTAGLRDSCVAVDLRSCPFSSTATGRAGCPAGWSDLSDGTTSRRNSDVHAAIEIVSTRADGGVSSLPMASSGGSSQSDRARLCPGREQGHAEEELEAGLWAVPTSPPCLDGRRTDAREAHFPVLASCVPRKGPDNVQSPYRRGPANWPRVPVGQRCRGFPASERDHTATREVQNVVRSFRGP